jgi:hypothetical protein
MPNAYYIPVLFLLAGLQGAAAGRSFTEAVQRSPASADGKCPTCPSDAPNACPGSYDCCAGGCCAPSPGGSHCDGCCCPTDPTTIPCPTPPVAPTPAPPACAPATPAPPTPLSGKYSGLCKIAAAGGVPPATCMVGEYVNVSITFPQMSFNSTRADWFPNCGPKGTFSYLAIYSDPCAAAYSDDMFSFGEPCGRRASCTPNDGACTGGCYTGLDTYCGDNCFEVIVGVVRSSLSVTLNPNSGLLSGVVAYSEPDTYGYYTCNFDSLSQNCFCQNSKCVVDPAATLPCAKCNTPGACV